MMLASTPLFYAYDWPRRALCLVTRTKLRNNSTPQSDSATVPGDDDDDDDDDGGGGDNVDSSIDAVHDGDKISQSTQATNTPSKVCGQKQNIILSLKSSQLNARL